MKDSLKSDVFKLIFWGVAVLVGGWYMINVWSFEEDMQQRYEASYSKQELDSQ